MRVNSLPYFNVCCNVKKMNIMEIMKDENAEMDEKNGIAISMSVVVG